MKTFRFFITLVSALLISSAAFAAEYTLDPTHSSVAFKVKHLMISNVSGSFDDYSAVIDFDEKTKTLKKLEATVSVDSIDTGIEKRDTHLKSDDFFSAETYPDMTFKMTKLSGDSITGDLTIRDITQRVTFEYEFGGMVTDPWGRQVIAFEMEGKISRKSFGLKWNKAMETGGVVVGDDVKIMINIEAAKK